MTDTSPLFEKIDSLLAGTASPLLIAIDGRCASGKTTLAASLSKHYDCSLFHMDDFFLRPSQRTASRLAEPGGNVDRERFEEEVLLPLSRGEGVAYRRYDCHTKTLLPPVFLPLKRLNIIEGSYSHHPELRGYYTFTVCLGIDRKTQTERLIARNGKEGYERFEKLWIPLEEAYFNTFSIEEKADLLL